MIGVDVTGANLSSAFLGGAKLGGTDLSAAKDISRMVAESESQPSGVDVASLAGDGGT